MTWRNPLQEFDETGYTEFQRLNINNQGEIDPLGERIIRKLFNPTTISVAYKEFVAVIYRYWYSQTQFPVVSTEATLRDANWENPTTIDPGLYPGKVINKGDWWWIKKGNDLVWSNDNGVSWNTETGLLGTQVPISWGETVAWITTTRQFRVWNKNTNTGDLIGTSWDGSTVALNGSYELMSGTMITDEVFNDNGRLFIAYSAEMGDGVATLKNITQFYYSDDGITWNRGSALENNNAGWVAWMEKMSPTVTFVYGSYDFGGMFLNGTGIIKLTTDLSIPSNDFSGIIGYSSVNSAEGWLERDKKDDKLFLTYNPFGDIQFHLFDVNLNVYNIDDLGWGVELTENGFWTLQDLRCYFTENNDECILYAQVDEDGTVSNKIYTKSPIIDPYSTTNLTLLETLANTENYLFKKIE